MPTSLWVLLLIGMSGGGAVDCEFGLRDAHGGRPLFGPAAYKRFLGRSMRNAELCGCTSGKCHGTDPCGDACTEAGECTIWEECHRGQCRCDPLLSAGEDGDACGVDGCGGFMACVEDGDPYSTGRQTFCKLDDLSPTCHCPPDCAGQCEETTVCSCGKCVNSHLADPEANPPPPPTRSCSSFPINDTDCGICTDCLQNTNGLLLRGAATFTGSNLLRLIEEGIPSVPENFQGTAFHVNLYDLCRPWVSEFEFSISGGGSPHRGFAFVAYKPNENAPPSISRCEPCSMAGCSDLHTYPYDCLGFMDLTTDEPASMGNGLAVAFRSGSWSFTDTTPATPALQLWVIRDANTHPLISVVDGFEPFGPGTGPHRVRIEWTGCRSASSTQILRVRLAQTDSSWKEVFQYQFPLDSTLFDDIKWSGMDGGGYFGFTAAQHRDPNINGPNIEILHWNFWSDYCHPGCAEKCGGPDGCGGFCPHKECPFHIFCSETSGECVCDPRCEGRECGPWDGCGGYCGTGCPDVEIEPGKAKPQVCSAALDGPERGTCIDALYPCTACSATESCDLSGGGSGHCISLHPPPQAVFDFVEDFTAASIHNEDIPLSYNPNALVMVQDATILENALRITPQRGFQGAVWTLKPMWYRSGLRTDFTFEFSRNMGYPGEGIAFVMQSMGPDQIAPCTACADPCRGPLPQPSNCMGFLGIPHGLAVAFDQRPGPQITVMRTEDGVVLGSVSHETPFSRLPDFSSDGPLDRHTVRIEYSPTSHLLRVLMKDEGDEGAYVEQLRIRNFHLPSILHGGGNAFGPVLGGENSVWGAAWMGFTGSTGPNLSEGGDNHFIHKWSLVPDCISECEGMCRGVDLCRNPCPQSISCPDGTECDEDGICSCAPECTGRECGPNGCGEECGTCDPEFVCLEGRCGTPLLSDRDRQEIQIAEGHTIQESLTFDQDRIQPHLPVRMTITTNPDPVHRVHVVPATQPFVFDASNYSLPFVVSLTVTDDFVADGNESIRIEHRIVGDEGFDWGNEGPSFLLHIIDDDTVGVIIEPDQVAVEGGQNGTGSLRLSSHPLATVTLSLSVDETQITTIDPTRVVLEPASWNQSQSFTVMAEDDGETTESTFHDGLIFIMTSSTDPNYNGEEVAMFPLKERDVCDELGICNSCIPSCPASQVCYMRFCMDYCREEEEGRVVEYKWRAPSCNEQTTVLCLSASFFVSVRTSNQAQLERWKERSCV